MIYLACPYTDDDEEVRRMRVDAATAAAASLMADGEAVFSPLTHSVAIEPLLPRDLAHSHTFWMRQDLPVLSGCDRLVVLMLEGWNRSRGVREEIETAESMGIDVEYMEA